MNRSARALLFRLLASFVLAGSLFAAGVGPARHLETSASGALLAPVAGNRVQVQMHTSLQVFPVGRRAFRATLTPSCSALSSALAIIVVGLFLPAPSRRRRVVSCAVAAALVVGCNLVRIAASIGVGLLLGRVTLVMFHDWVGSAFTFAYTLAGLLVLIYLRMPKEPLDTEGAL